MCRLDHDLSAKDTPPKDAKIVVSYASYTERTEPVFVIYSYTICARERAFAQKHNIYWTTSPLTQPRAQHSGAESVVK